MKKLTFLSLALAVGLMAAGTFLPVTTSGHKLVKFQRSQQPVANQYIVVLNEDFVGRSAEAPVVDAEAQFLSSLYGGRVRRVYSNSLKGFSTTMTPAEAETMSRDERVMFVEEDTEISVATTQTNVAWHLDRVDQRNLPMDSNYNYGPTGSGAHVYVLDTGIRATHEEFGGRASVAYDVINDGQNGNDCHGHGTHVAGIVGGVTYGVAKNVSLHAVRVLPCTGNGTVSDLMYGIEWVVANRINPAIANISITAAGPSSALETQIANATTSGILFTVAAGNNAYDACFFTPARTPAAITVGASYQEDARAPFSTFGTCVDIFAPGFEVLSAGTGSDSATRVMSGTSMAAPMVAGIAAIYRGANPSANAGTASQAVLNAATSGILGNVGVGSPNKLLFAWMNGGPSPGPSPTPTATPTPSPTATPAPSPTPLAGRVTIIKRVRGNGGGTSGTTTFPYAATNISTSNFSLTSNQEFTDPNIAGNSTLVAVTEAAVSGWQLTSVECVEVSGGSPNVLNTTVDLANRRANIVVENGETVTCTFTSDELAPTAGEATVGGRVVDRRGRGVRGISLSLLNTSTGQMRWATTNGFGYYTFTDLDIMDVYTLTAFNSRKYTIVNNVRTFTLHDDLANVDFFADSPDR